MKMVELSAAKGLAMPIPAAEPTVPRAGRGLAAFIFSQRACNSDTNAVGSMSSDWTSVLRQYVAKKVDSVGSCEIELPTKKNCWSRSSDSRDWLDIRRRNRPSQSGISQPMNSIG